MDNDVEKLFEDGVNYYEQSKMDKAEHKFLEALQMDSSSDEIKYNLALVYLEKKDYSKTNFLISQIREFDCDEIIDELEKLEIDIGHDNPINDLSTDKSSLIKQYIEDFVDQLNDEFLPKSINCEFCDSEIKLSEIERQNRYYNCPLCKNESNVREKERAIENDFKNKPDTELFEMLIESQNFRLEYSLAAKKEIKRRNIDLANNEDFKYVLNNNI
jgi:hypothetical protein